MAMEVTYPGEEKFLDEYGLGMLIVTETHMHYGNLMLPICDDAFKYYSFVSNPYAFDYYSVLHLPPSSTHKQVEHRYYKLRNEVLSLAKSNLSDKILCSNFDTNKRKDFVFLDWPLLRCSDDNETTAIASSSFKESYLDWKPPVYHVDVIDHMKSAHLHDYDEELEVREGMILGLEVAFTKLCEEIRNLVDLQSFWHGLDGFNEQLSQLKEMGYNVEKVREKIDILKGIGDGERASRAAVVKIEYEIRDRETVVNALCSRISDLQARIEESKDMIANSKSKIDTLKKDSCNTMVKFTSAAKSKWG